MKGAGVLNPRTKEYEWLGPFGATMMFISLPLTVLGLNAMCSEDGGCELSSALNFFGLIESEIRKAIPNLAWAAGIEIGWILLHCLLYFLPIGSVVKGMPLRDGKTLTYNINALHIFFMCHIAAALLHLIGMIDLGVLAENFFALALMSVIITAVASVGLYIASYRSSNTLCALGGNSGNFIYDMWVGRELNPRIGSLDLKFMFELRPGLIGWSLLNWAHVARAYETGNLGSAIVLVSILESFYVFEALLFEAGNLTMMDIVVDGFGYMLCFGDLTWVPFIYTLKTRFLLLNPQHHDNIYLGFCMGMFAVGYMLFRCSNSEKDRFRKNPKDPRVAHLKVMKTSAGKSLLISGYWGVCRHPNYVGDWLITTAWSLLAGTTYALPYFQPLYFAILLVHRQFRDEHSMEQKYGKEDWEKFCKLVPYRLFPYVY